MSPSDQPAGEFIAPREHFTIDVDALRASVPHDIEVKRMLVDIVSNGLDGELTPDQVLADLGLDFSGVAAHEEIRWHDYFSVMAHVAEVRRGREHLSLGLREIGRSFYRGVLSTPLGKMLLGRQLGDAVRNIADTWAEFNTLGRVWSDFTSERSFDYNFEGFPMSLAESVGVGIFEGMFAYHFMPVTILIRRDARDRGALRLRW